MSIIKKFVNIFSKNKEILEEMKWSMSFEEKGILLSSNKDINKLEDIKDLLIMYEIDDLNSNSILISYDEIYDLYFDEYDNKIDAYKLFNLPQMFKGNLNIQNKNNFLTDKEVYFTFSFKGTDNSPYSVEKENVLVSSLNSEYRIMPKKLYELIKQITAYNIDINKRSDEAMQFEMLKIIKDYTNEVDIVLNERLRLEEEPIIIDKIKIDFNDDGDLLEIYPKLSDDENTNKMLLNNIDSYDDVRGMYSAQVNGKRVRYVIKNKKTLDTIRRNKTNRGQERLNILSGKSEIFQDENIDISDFGPRVTGIGYLTYKNSSPTIKTNDLDWLDNNIELPYIQGSNVDGNSEKIILKPEDREMLQVKLANMNITGDKSTEVEFTNEFGDKTKVIMQREDIVQEIKNISSRIKEPMDIKRVSDLENLISLCDKYEEEKYIPYKGIYLLKGAIDIKEELISRLEEIREKQDDTNSNKKKTLLIAENLDIEEYKEVDKVDKKTHIIEVPKGLRDGISLFDYQKECLGKLQELYLSSNVNGFLLCDDMGLGKTLQLLSFLAWLKERDEVTPSLIVAPTSLLNNWDSTPNGEIQKFFKDNYFTTDRIVGTITRDRVEELKKKDIVFITYESLRLNNILLGTINWKVMICDEAQKIKSPRTMVTVAAKAQNADFKIICSATPIENTLEELWTLVDYSKPGLLGSLKDFKKEYIIKSDNVSNKELQDLNDKLYSKIENFYIRREKDILPKALPNKSIKLYKVKATTEELEVLEKIKDTEEHTLSAIQKMLGVCSHVDVLSENIVNKSNINNIIKKSSKLLRVKGILEEIKSKDEKVIIFTRLKKVQKILHLAISEWFGVESYIVNGEDSNLDRRTSKINEFRESKGFNVIILSPEVAGFGITITEANHVIHYTRLWNPAKEDQATDRVYRIGQTKDVIVHYPMISFGKNETVEYGKVTDYVHDNFIRKDEALSPEEKLNILLARKKDMLLNFFLAAGNGEIKTKDFLSLDSDEENKKDNINMDYIERNIITPHEFEALVAVLYEKLGYTTYVTSRSNDNGVDVIALNDKEILFIQCKHTKHSVAREAIKDVIFAMDTYKDYLNKRVAKGVIVTSSKKIAYSTRDRNDIIVIDNAKLTDLLNEYKVFKNEVDIKDNERYSYESLVRKILTC